MKPKNLIIRGGIAIAVILLCITFSNYYNLFENFFLNLILYFAIMAFMTIALFHGYKDIGFGILTGLFAVIATIIIITMIQLLKSF